LLLTVGIASGSPNLWGRIERAVTPTLFDTPVTPVVELWVTPPAYTGRPPLALLSPSARPSATSGSDSTSPLEILRGSMVLARASQVGKAPLLIVGQQEHRFTSIAAKGDRAGPQSFSAEVPVESSGLLAIRIRGRSWAQWPLTVVTDSVPTVAFLEAPEAVNNGLTRLAFTASDDHQVREVMAVISLPGSPSPEASSAIRLSMPLTTVHGADVSGVKTEDLSAHSWAGSPVSIAFEALDSAGQLGVSAATEFVLPERSFSHPVAQAVIAERRRLFAPTDEVVQDVVRTLAALAAEPAYFADDVVVALALSVARARLLHDRSAKSASSVRDLLWETALRLDEGDVPAAERTLQAARDQLSQALRQNAPVAEIERLIDALQDALGRYLAAVAAELARRDGDKGPLSPDPTLLAVTDLKEMVEMTRRLARTGAREAASQMLSDLQRMLDAIREGMTSDQRQQLRQANALLSRARELGKRQQQLLDETFQRLKATPAPQKGRSNPAGERGEAAAGAQQDLRRQLGELMLEIDDFLGGIPSPFGEADQAMQGAAKALKAEKPADAVLNQSNAVDSLNRAADALGQAVAEKFGAVAGLMLPGGEDDGGSSGDPFGRTPGDGVRGFGLGDIKIPDEMELRRAQGILDELRRRASEHRRPALERDYIDRLLRRF
jgi:uncharacterized protein (TIGR02302 family)